MPTPKLNYEILPPNTIVEASFSREADDRSEVDFTIEVSNPVVSQPETGVTLSKITFEVPASLTANSRRIIPAVREPGWTFKRKQDGVNGAGAIFEATPLAGTFTVIPGDDQTLGFRLLDVEIADTLGTAAISVTETAADGSVGTTELKVRKVSPTLRIDFFNASASTTTAVSDTDHTLKLRWATTGATEVVLEGLSGKDQESFNAAFSANPLSAHDAEFSVHPKTTATYTLRAKNNVSDAAATAQLTISVTDNDPAPPGTIVAWSPVFRELPTHWVLCDGSRYRDEESPPNIFTVPNLKDRFIRGASAISAGAEVGTQSVTLTPSNLPGHSHPPEGTAPNGEHSHSSFFISTSLPLNLSIRNEMRPINGSAVLDALRLVAAAEAGVQAAKDEIKDKPWNVPVLQAHPSSLLPQHFETSGDGAHAHGTSNNAAATAFDIVPLSLELAYIIKLKPNMTKVTTP